MHEELHRFAERELGPCRIEHDHSWGHRGASVLRLRAADGVEWYAKRHLYAELHAREVHAYRHWAPALGDRAPTLRAYDEIARSVLLSALPGSGATQDDPDVHHQAGLLLRRLHDAETLSSWHDHVADKLATLDYWADRAGDLLTRRELEFARGEIRSLQGIPDPVRVPCHLDYSPRNWLVAAGRVQVIDFEWSGPEVWVNDLGRLFFGPWRGAPGLQEAFLDGYGRGLTADDRALLLASYALTTLWHLTWAREHGNHSFADGVRDLLGALMRREFD